MNYAICIIAKDEERTVGRLVHQLSRQSILHHGHSCTIYVVCNGCSDNTARSAEGAISAASFPNSFRSNVLDYQEAGKAKFWNLTVHEIVESDIDLAIFIDADVELADDHVLFDLVAELEEHDDAVAVSGWPVKDIAKKANKSLLDQFSLRVSSETSFPHAINGSLYVARMQELRRIWLPVPIPGEDGMLTAMIHTNGFSHPPKLELVRRVGRPTHYFEAHTIRGFFRHEKRMTIGTTINGWLCEFFWAGEHTVHVGKLVRNLNEQTPEWVDELVRNKVGTKFWALPPRLLTWRLQNLRNVGFFKAITRAPFSLAATALNIFPCILANRTLRQRAASNYW